MFTDKKYILDVTKPAWDVSERSQSDFLWERHLRDFLETSQKRWLFCDVFKTSQIHLKKHVFFLTFLRRLKNISKKMSFAWLLCDVSSISRKGCLYPDVTKTSQKHLSQVFVIFQCPTKMVACDFRMVIKISDKIDVGP